IEGGCRLGKLFGGGLDIGDEGGEGRVELAAVVGSAGEGFVGEDEGQRGDVIGDDASPVCAGPVAGGDGEDAGEGDVEMQVVGLAGLVAADGRDRLAAGD